MKKETLKNMLNMCGGACALSLVTPYREGGREFSTVNFRNQEGKYRIWEDFITVIPEDSLRMHLSRIAELHIPYEQIAFVINNAFPLVNEAVG